MKHAGFFSFILAMVVCPGCIPANRNERITYGRYLRYGTGDVKTKAQTIDIGSEPAGAKVYVDGKEVGQTPLSYAFKYKEKITGTRREKVKKWEEWPPFRLPQGWVCKSKLLGYEYGPDVVEDVETSYRVVVYKDGYAQRRFDMTVPCAKSNLMAFLTATAPKVTTNVQQQQQQTVVLGQPGSQSAKVGTVNIGSIPDGCEVFIDGAYVGNTPATLKLSEGMHKLELKAQGFKVWQRSIRVLSDSSTQMKVRLERQ